MLGKGGGALPPLLQLSLLRLLITWLNECPAAAAFCAPTEVPLTLTLAPDPSLDPNPDPSPDPNLKPKPTPNPKPQTQT